MVTGAPNDWLIGAGVVTGATAKSGEIEADGTTACSVVAITSGSGAV
jgi:hypothetical protein